MRNVLAAWETAYSYRGLQAGEILRFMAARP